MAKSIWKRPNQAINPLELLEHLPVIVYREAADDRDDFLYISSLIEQVLGLAPHALTSRSGLLASYLHPDDRAHVNARSYGRSVSTTTIVSDCRLIGAGGRVHWFQDHCRLVRDEAGQMTHVDGIMVDVSQQKRREISLSALGQSLEEEAARQAIEAQQLRATHLSIVAERRECSALLERAQCSLDNCPDAVITFDPEGIIGSFNPTAQDIFGYHAEQVVGQHLETLFADGHGRDLIRVRRDASFKAAIEPQELIARRTDGSTFPVNASVNEIDCFGTQVAFLRDISQLRSIQRRVVEAEERERQAIGQELHDTIQAELVGIALVAQTLANRLPPIQSTGESLGMTGAEAAELHQLARQLTTHLDAVQLHVQSLARGLISYPVEADGLAEALREVANRTCQLYDVTCRYIGEPNVEVENEVVATHLYRIAQEAVTNALKHSHSNVIELQIEKTPSTIVLQVLDDGNGIDVPMQSNAGSGLQTMTCRASLIGASLHWSRRPNGGTNVQCIVPIRP